MSILETRATDAQGRYILYHYDPNLPAAAVAAGVFGLLTLAHVAQMTMKRAWFFVPFCIGGIFEMIGYIARGISSHDRWAKIPYAMQSLLLLLGPVLLAATIYMTLARIVELLDGERYSLIPRRWLTKTFVYGDVAVFMLQSGGGAVLADAKTKSKTNLGRGLIIGGLMLQIVMLFFFFAVAIVFHRRVRHHASHVTAPWKKHLHVLYLTTGMVLVRSEVRAIEYIMGEGSFLMKQEAFIYVFDALLMVICMVAFNIVHPGDILGRKSTDSLESGNRFELAQGSSNERTTEEAKWTTTHTD